MVTGGSSGIGYGIVQSLAGLGAEITITGRNLEKLQAAAESLGPNVRYAQGDVRQAEDVNRTVQDHLSAHGRIDFLINNAAGNFLCPVEKMSENAFASVMGIVAHGTFLYCKAVLEPMRSQGGGKIINIGATYAWNHAAMVAHSGAAKAAVLSLTRSLAVEWGPYNIQTNMIAPGPVEGTEGVKRLLSHPELAKKMLRMLPTQRMAKPEEIGSAACFLLHPMTRYINGIALPVDGGSHLVVPGLLPAGLDMLMEG
ncbi:MAG: SDR family oxidoreductase [Acidobacteria bacterium]|nr:SDR family oxidoreductase [Acidobacteriota bacterium]